MKISELNQKLFIIAKNNYPIIIILAIGFFVRFYRIYFDYPRVDFVWDEIYNIAYLFDFIDQKRLIVNPSSSTYPIVLPILIAPVLALRLIYLALVNGLYSAAELKNHLIEYGMGQVYIVARWYSVAFGTAAIYFIYWIYRLIYKEKLSSYYAALVYSVSLIPVFISHWGKHHSVMAFFYVLSLYFILKFEKEKNFKFYFYSLISAALSVSTHYVGLSAVIFPAYAVLANRKKFNFKILAKSFAVYTGLVLFFYLFNYYGISKMIFLMNRDYYSQNGYVGIYKTGILERFYYLFRDYFIVDPVFTVLFLVMLFVSFRNFIKDRLIRYVLAGLAFNYLVMTTIIVGPRSMRWFIIFINLIIPLAAASFIDLLLKKNIKQAYIYSAAALLVIPSIIITGLWLNILKSDTRIEASDWLIKNVPQEKTYSFIYPFTDQYSHEAAVWNSTNNSNMTFRKIQYIIDNKNRFENKGIDILYDRGNNRYQELGGKDTQYVVFGYSQPFEREDFLNKIKKFHRIELVKFFYPTSDPRLISTGIDNDYLNNPLDWQTLMRLDKSGGFIDIFKIL
jgi:hypothetical protein